MSPQLHFGTMIINIKEKMDFLDQGPAKQRQKKKLRPTDGIKSDLLKFVCEDRLEVL